MVSDFDDKAGHRDRMVLKAGLYMLSDTPYVGGARALDAGVVLSYRLDDRGYPPATPGTGWTVTVERLGLGRRASTTVAYTFGQPDRISFGACGYDAMPVVITYPDLTPPGTQKALFLPELGLSYLVGDGPGYVSVEAVQ